MLRNPASDPNLSVVKSTKHFVTVTSEDSNDFTAASFNPGDIRITFNNSALTSVTSAKDNTKTTIIPIAFFGDLYYYNVSPNFKNNKFRILSSSGKELSSTINGVANTRENSVVGDAGYDEATWPTVTIAEGMYNAAELGAAILAALNASTIRWWSAGGGTPIVWTNTAVDGNGRLTLAYATAHPTLTPNLHFYSAYTYNGETIDSSRILGMTSAVITQAGGAAANVYGGFILPYANRLAGVQTPKVVDIKTLQKIYVHSNIAGRHAVKRGYTASGAWNPEASQRPLTMTDILFSFAVDKDMGSTFVFEPVSPDVYSQEILNNWDEMRIYLTDAKGQLIKFINQAEITFTFSVLREYIVPSAEDRIKNLMNYNAYQQ
jgi:hypothetical protein